MTQHKVRVGINGYGVIGKRVADAVRLQDDMELAGVADITHDYRIRVALERGYRVFAATADARDAMHTQPGCRPRGPSTTSWSKSTSSSIAPPNAWRRSIGPSTNEPR